VIVKPETAIAWHREGFRLYWSWKSRCRNPGRPEVSVEVRDLIRKMSIANPIWGAPRIHGELLKRGINISETTVAKYMVWHRKPPSQSWKAFLKNHAQQFVSVDFLVVPTLSFRLLFVFVVLGHHRRGIIQFNVTAHPTAEWTAQQMLEAFCPGEYRHFVTWEEGKKGKMNLRRICYLAVSPDTKVCTSLLPTNWMARTKELPSG
jgi:hypothetical protein